jgi:hypothetical protein
MHKRKGSWYSNFWINGVRYQKSWEAISKTAAKEKEMKKTQIREGKHFEKSKRILFEKVTEKYLEHVKLDKKLETLKRHEVSSMCFSVLGRKVFDSLVRLRYIHLNLISGKDCRQTGGIGQLSVERQRTP